MSPHAAKDAALKDVADITGEVPQPLTVDSVPARRAKTMMPTGVAASCDSDMFKSLVCTNPLRYKQ